MKQIAECDTESQKNTLQKECVEEERTNRRRELGNIRFIGELFKFNMLLELIIFECIEKLLRQKDEGSLEGLCQLFTTIGKELETRRGKDSKDFLEKKDLIDCFFTEMRRIIRECKTSSRVRFMLQDVIDLRESDWIPQRGGNNWKTIDKTHKKTEKYCKPLLFHNRIFPPPINQKESNNQGRQIDNCVVDSKTGKVGSRNSNNIELSRQKKFARQMYPDVRSSQSGQSEKTPKEEVVSSSVNLNIEQPKTENTGKAHKGDKDNTEDLLKTLSGILNRFRLYKFDTFVLQVQTLEIDTEEKLKGVVDLIYENAIAVPNYNVPYANLCKHLASIKVPCADKEGGFVYFWKLLLTKCQYEYEKVESELRRKEKVEQIAECDTESQIKLKCWREGRRKQVRKVQNIRFIGELFKFNMLTEGAMHRCIRQLLQQRDEDSIECLYQLLNTVGMELEMEEEEDPDFFQKKKYIMNYYFAEISRIERESQRNSQVSFLLQKVKYLRQSHWMSSLFTYSLKPTEAAYEQQLLFARRNKQFRASRRPLNSLYIGTNQGREISNQVFTTPTGKTSSFYSNNSDTSKPNFLDCPEIEGIELNPSGHGFMSLSQSSNGGYNQNFREQESKPATVLSSSKSAASSQELSSDGNNQGSPMIRKTPVTKEGEIAREATMPLAHASQAKHKAVKELVKAPDTENVEADVLRGRELCGEMIEIKTKPLLNEFLHTANSKKLELISKPCYTDVTPAEMKKKFDMLLNADQIDSIHDWINSNLGAEKVKKPIFIRTLVTALFENSIAGSGDKCDMSMEKTKSAYIDLMMFYIGEQEDLQLSALYALQALMHRLDHPKGVLDTIFNHLYDKCVISMDNYIIWKEWKNPAEQEGKDDAVASVHEFFSGLIVDGEN